MGNQNERIFIASLAARLDGPYLEVGSRDYGNTQDLRVLFTGRGPYVGVDMTAGPGVDVVLDLTEEFPAVDAKVQGRRFGTVFCLSVLEHCEQPFRLAENVTRLLRPGGWLCLSAPFSWRLHGYPHDYWRFTPEGVRKLFPLLDFGPAHCRFATSRTGEGGELDEDLGKLFFSFRRWRQKGQSVRGVSAELLRVLARLGLLRWLAGERYVFAPTMVLMAGQKPFGDLPETQPGG